MLNKKGQIGALTALLATLILGGFILYSSDPSVTITTNAFVGENVKVTNSFSVNSGCVLNLTSSTCKITAPDGTNTTQTMTVEGGGNPASPYATCSQYSSINYGTIGSVNTSTVAGDLDSNGYNSTGFTMENSLIRFTFNASDTIRILINGSSAYVPFMRLGWINGFFELPTEQWSNLTSARWINQSSSKAVLEINFTGTNDLLYNITLEQGQPYISFSAQFYNKTTQYAHYMTWYPNMNNTLVFDTLYGYSSFNASDGPVDTEDIMGREWFELSDSTNQETDVSLRVILSSWMWAFNQSDKWQYFRSPLIYTPETNATYSFTFIRSQKQYCLGQGDFNLTCEFAPTQDGNYTVNTTSVYSLNTCGALNGNYVNTNLTTIEVTERNTQLNITPTSVSQTYTTSQLPATVTFNLTNIGSRLIKNITITNSTYWNEPSKTLIQNFQKQNSTSFTVTLPSLSVGTYTGNLYINWSYENSSYDNSTAIPFSITVSSGVTPTPPSPGATVSPPRVVYPVCGDGVCESNATYFENKTSCPNDCIICGDSVCDITETLESCPGDCMPICGNDICEFNETVTNCPSDCIPALVAYNLVYSEEVDAFKGLSKTAIVTINNTGQVDLTNARIEFTVPLNYTISYSPDAHKKIPVGTERMFIIDALPNVAGIRKIDFKLVTDQLNKSFSIWYNVSEIVEINETLKVVLNDELDTLRLYYENLILEVNASKAQGYNVRDVEKMLQKITVADYQRISILVNQTKYEQAISELEALKSELKNVSDEFSVITGAYLIILMQNVNTILSVSVFSFMIMIYYWLFLDARRISISFHDKCCEKSYMEGLEFWKDKKGVHYCKKCWKKLKKKKAK